MRAKKTAVKILCDSGFSIYDIRSRKFHGTREKKREKLIWGGRLIKAVREKREKLFGESDLVYQITKTCSKACLG